MKIALPVEANGTEICPSFGRTGNFLIVDTETKEKKMIDNSAISTQGGAGIKAAQVLVDEDVNIVLTPRCGENAVDVMKEAEIKLYKTEGSSVEENIQAYLDGKLGELTEVHQGLHGHGGN